jgi:N-hydroxyarylamine O-acetyltransferase
MSAPRPLNDELDLQAYLLRIGVSPVAATREGLITLHEAHLAAIPFENLDVLLGRPIRLDLGALQSKLVGARRGGYCFEQNSLFRAALLRLGFRVTPLAARVRVGSDAIRPRTHMLLRVDLPEGPFLADVGFGGDGFVRPLPLAATVETWEGQVGFRLVRADEGFVLQTSQPGVWTDLYVFTLEPQHPVDYEMANHFTSTYEHSPFLQNLTAQRSWPGRRLILRNRDLVSREGDKVTATTIRDPDHLLAVLDRDFGLVFPPGTRFAKPEF